MRSSVLTKGDTLISLHLLTGRSSWRDETCPGPLAVPRDLVQFRTRLRQPGCGSQKQNEADGQLLLLGLEADHLLVGDGVAQCVDELVDPCPGVAVAA